jgi:hypothetical protein
MRHPRSCYRVKDAPPAGAAANTVIFMRFIEALAASQAPPKPTMQNAPVIKTVEIKQEVTGTFGISK